MNDNRLFVRDLVGVVLAIACLTTLTLWLVPASDHAFVEPPAHVDAPVGSPIVRGAHVYEAKGCIACHTVDGTPRVGPTFLHDYGSQVALSDGRTVAMDDTYIRESILHPQAAARPGYPPSMPTFEGMVSDKDIAALTAYLRSLR